MRRRDFITQGCTACLGFTVAAAFGSGCVATQHVGGTISQNGLTLNKSDFKIRQKGGTAYSSFIIVRNESLKFPICLYRNADNDYTALWMECTHQGAELSASGDVLQCAAHGSEFNRKGAVINGPASTALRSFPVTVSNDEIFIDLRKKA